MITFKQKGDFSKTIGFLERCKEVFGEGDLDKYGQMGVAALMQATPKDTGKTAASWEYDITHDSKGATISWYNTNEANNGECIAILLQYGHATGRGTYVQGRDYINPAIQPLFDAIADQAWDEVNK